MLDPGGLRRSGVVPTIAAMKTPRFKKIDHLGIAVPSLADAVPLYEALLGGPVEHVEEVADQRVRAAFFTVGESHFELLEPTDPESPIAKYLETRRGGSTTSAWRSTTSTRCSKSTGGRGCG